jgi:hypothetical protein
MSTNVAPASIFRASAIAAAGVPWLVDGFHLRVKLNPWIGFPLHPFAAWRLEVFDTDQPTVHWRDRQGKSLTIPFDLESAGGFAEGALFGVPADNPYIWMEIDVDDRGLRLDLLDGRIGASSGARIIASRSRGPYRFGHTSITRLRASGAGTIGGVRALPQQWLAIREWIERKPDLTFGLPLGLGKWFAPDRNVDPLKAAKRRVATAAPTRLSPPDNPSGSLPDDSDPDAEMRRIMERIAPEFIDPWLKGGWTEPTKAPVHAVLGDATTTGNMQRLEASAPITPSLLTMAVDPQIARYLGLATTIPFEETSPMQPANIWIIAARWAVQLDRVIQPSSNPFASPVTMGDLLQSLAPTSWLDGILGGIFPDTAGIIADLPNRPRDGHGPWTSLPLIAVAVAAGDAPPDPPDPFQLASAEPGSWTARLDPTSPGPERWRQAISLGSRPARGMVGFARTAPDGPVALHRFEPPPGQDHVSRALPIVPSWASNNRRIVEDRMVPADPGGASWTVWQADEFGQWSAGADLELSLPARPNPPEPQVEVSYRADPDDGSIGLRVPGTLRLKFDVPELVHTEPGGLPITELRVSVDGTSVPPEPVAPGDTLVLEAEPPPFGVGEQRNIPIIATYFDTAGTPSASPVVLCAAYDARAPEIIPTSPMVLWTGQSDATGQAELALRWPPRQGAARYRVYLGDARRLAGELGMSMADSPIRASQANPIYLASARLTYKGAFTFLGETPGTTAGDGFVHFATRIPGGLRSVQFVRIVPVSAGGAEPPFNSCGLVPVAVPSLDRPAPPLLDAITDPIAGLTLTIRARGLRPDLLAAAPDGLPEYRLRRTRRDLDRRFAPVWTNGYLTGPDAEGVWTATLTLPPVQQDRFIRTTWYAEVRYPPEPAIPPGPVPLPADGGIEPVWAKVGDSSEALWSEPSLAAEALLVPPDAPDAPPVPAVTTEADGSVVLTVAGLPTVHGTTSDPYRLEVYRGQPGEAVAQRDMLDLLTPNVTWTDPAPVPADARYDLVIVDPIGRRSPATSSQ